MNFVTEGIFEMDSDLMPSWRRRWEREQRLAQSALEVARKRQRPVLERLMPDTLPESARKYATGRAQHVVEAARIKPQ